MTFLLPEWGAGSLCVATDADFTLHKQGTKRLDLALLSLTLDPQNGRTISTKGQLMASQEPAILLRPPPAADLITNG